MTPVPPSSSDGAPLPPRHRPTLGDLSKDTTEADLWDLEDDLSLPGDPAPPRQDGARSGRELPGPREKKVPKGSEAEGSGTKLPPPVEEEKIRINVNRVRQMGRPAASGSGQSKPESEFDDLEQWEDVRPELEVEELPADQSPPEGIDEPVGEAPVESVAEIAQPESDEPVRELADGGRADEFSPAPVVPVRPVSLRPTLGLSKVERMGMIALAVLLAAIAGVAYMFSLDRLPREGERVRAADFPIRGELISIQSATNYWREPITDGASPDTFRRGTRLLPVLEMEVAGGPAAVRVLFRNEDRAVVGDVITREVVPGVKLSIAATAGFDDPGMHAAYRTGESKPWTIEVYEAADRNAPGRDFKKVFEMNISTDLR